MDRRDSYGYENENSINTRVSVSEQFIVNYYIYVAIAFVYVVFVSMLVDKAIGYETYEKDCESSVYLMKDNSFNSKQQQLCTSRREKLEGQKFMYMMVFGVGSLLAGGALVMADDKSYKTAGLGIALGGVFAIIYYTLSNWSKLEYNQKIAVLGLALAGLVYGSTKIYKY